MLVNFHLRGIDEKIMQILKKEAREKNTSVNLLILSFIKNGLGLIQGRKQVIFHDLDKLAGTWSKSQTKKFMQAIGDINKI